MKVKDLIQQLRHYDPDLEVSIAPTTFIEDYDWFMESKTAAIIKLFHAV